MHAAPKSQRDDDFPVDPDVGKMAGSSVFGLESWSGKKTTNSLDETRHLREKPCLVAGSCLLCYIEVVFHVPEKVLKREKIVYDIENRPRSRGVFPFSMDWAQGWDTVMVDKKTLEEWLQSRQPGGD